MYLSIIVPGYNCVYCAYFVYFVSCCWDCWWGKRREIGDFLGLFCWGVTGGNFFSSGVIEAYSLIDSDFLV
jgi:hypothetical protein